MPFVEGLKVTKCWIASLFFAAVNRGFLDFRPLMRDDLVDGFCGCGLQTNNQASMHADGRVLAGIGCAKGYTYGLGAAWSSFDDYLGSASHFCICIKVIAGACLPAQRVVYASYLDFSVVLQLIFELFAVLRLRAVGYGLIACASSS